jgi:hypothetical protein
MVSYYSLLGLPENATEDDIRKAYRRKAKEYHPDVNKAPDAQASFVKIQRAYEVLSDRQKRLVYDQKTRYTTTSTDPYANYAYWSRMQREKQEEEARRKHREFLKRKKEIQESRMYYPYMIALYIGCMILMGGALVILLGCAFAIIQYHFFLLFFLLPLICGAAYVLKFTIDRYRRYKALFA